MDISNEMGNFFHDIEVLSAEMESASKKSDSSAQKIFTKEITVFNHEIVKLKTK